VGVEVALRVPVSEVPVSEVPVSEVPVSEVPVSEVPAARDLADQLHSWRRTYERRQAEALAFQPAYPNNGSRQVGASAKYFTASELTRRGCSEYACAAVAVRTLQHHNRTEDNSSRRMPDSDPQWG
jgi:hypothetical protein